MTKNKLNGHSDGNDSENKKLKMNGNGSSSTNTTLMWFRTDLRVEDNRALERALINSRISNAPIIFLFLVSINEWKSHDYSPWKINFWLRNAQDLASQLNELGFPFIFKTIDSIQEAPKKVLEVCREFNSNEVFYNIDYEVNELKRDRLTTELLEGKGIKVRKFHDQCVVPPGEVLTDKDAPYSMFTLFKNRWYKNVYWKMDEPDLSYVRESKSVPGDEDIKLIKDSSLKTSNPELFSSKLPSNLDDFGFTKEQEEYSLKHYPSGHKVAYEKLQKFGKEKLRIFLR
ncbi:DNA photolyase [Conidiobolus coronatus NRRL 28638]|uniref:DNA photolyase n=1 Tax=Conidiobolus coronatus (strain ATCC 28846 / CBS 209.66 / NRRL 28638) TaxID=796925 RepID=A0A137NUA1_CONC2|nr:DNA photolyase [Conidiobolus coronatus NRRL 28638]|eukprot:KXN66326.1 DNA photolyase [Conidiobolus coronatus NRRL 28638]